MGLGSLNAVSLADARLKAAACRGLLADGVDPIAARDAERTQRALEDARAITYGTPGGTNCGFLTIEQCRATLSGNGGFCEPNQFYTGPETTPASRQRRHNQG